LVNFISQFEHLKSQSSNGHISSQYTSFNVSQIPQISPFKFFLSIFLFSSAATAVKITLFLSSKMSENRFLGNISASSFRNLLPKSVSTKKKLSSSRFKHKMNSENVAPIDPNIQISDPPLLPTSSILKKPVLKTIDSDVSAELTRSVAQEQTSEAPDPPVKVK